MDGELTRVKDPRPEVIEGVLAIVREADLQARLVANFLLSNGIKPHHGKTDGDTQAMPVGPAADFLLTLGAGLRLLMWEQTDIKAEMDEDLPDGTTVIASAAALIDNSESAGSRAHQLTLQIVRAAFRHLSRAANSELRTDIVIPRRIDGAVMRQRLAQFLFAHRNEMFHEGQNDDLQK
jgi:hypothetical protein